MYISKLHLQNWRNFKEIKARLQPRVFVIGPNAVGKSNLLDAFRFLRDLALPGGGLSTAVASRGGVSLVRCLYARQQSDIGFSVTISEDDDEVQWEYQLTIGQDKARRPLVKSEVVRDQKQKIVIQRPNVEDRADRDRLTQTSLEQISENKDFRPVADFFRTVSYQHLVPQVVRDPRGFSANPVRNDPFGRDFLLRVWNTPARTREARLKNITSALKVAIPQLSDLEAVMDNQGTPHLVGGFENWRPQAAKQNEAHFSDGTLRLLGLLWSAFEGDGPLLLEEPELSLHPEIVRRLPELFSAAARSRKVRSRQIVISTYSREMLADEGIDLDEVLVLRPTNEGTSVRVIGDAERLLVKQNSLTAADVLLPFTTPEKAYQLAFAFR